MELEVDTRVGCWETYDKKFKNNNQIFEFFVEHTEGYDGLYGRNNMIFDMIILQKDNIVKLMIKNKWKLKPEFIHGSVGTASHEITKLILDNLEQSIDNRSMGDILDLVGMNGDMEHLQLLIQHGINIRFRNELLLRAACTGGHYRMVEFLLDHGAKPNANRGAALKWAYKKGYVDIMNLLIERKAIVYPEFSSINYYRRDASLLARKILEKHVRR